MKADLFYIKVMCLNTVRNSQFSADFSIKLGAYIFSNTQPTLRLFEWYLPVLKLF